MHIAKERVDLQTEAVVRPCLIQTGASATSVWKSYISIGFLVNVAQAARKTYDPPLKILKIAWPGGALLFIRILIRVRAALDKPKNHWKYV